MKKVISGLVLSMILVLNIILVSNTFAGQVGAGLGCGPNSGCVVSGSTDTNATDSDCVNGYVCSQNKATTGPTDLCICKKAFGSGYDTIRDQAGLSSTSVPAIIGSVIKVILGVSGTVALIFIIWGGIKWMISKGDGGKIGEARKLMTSGMIGIAIIAAAYAITDFVIKQITVIAG